MNRWLNLLTIGLVCISMFGCSMCCGPTDFDYATFGGKHQRSNPSWGRVGSPFSDPGSFVIGPSADSNLSTAEDDGRNDENYQFEDLDLDDSSDLLEDLDRELDELNRPSPEPDDETTASQTWRQKLRRPGQRWR